MIGTHARPSACAGLGAAVLACAGLAQAQTSEILVQSSVTAGFAHHEAKAVWEQIKPAMRWRWYASRTIAHDPNAVRVEWNGHMLGYLPRTDNEAVARQLDRGNRLQARIVRLGQYRNHRRRLEVEVYLPLQMTERARIQCEHRRSAATAASCSASSLPARAGSRRCCSASSPALGAAALEPVDGGVGFSGDLALCYRVNLAEPHRQPRAVAGPACALSQRGGHLPRGQRARLARLVRARAHHPGERLGGRQPAAAASISSRCGSRMRCATSSARRPGGGPAWTPPTRMCASTLSSTRAASRCISTPPASRCSSAACARPRAKRRCARTSRPAFCS